MSTQIAVSPARSGSFKRPVMAVPPPAANRELGGPVDLMGAPMSFSRNAEIYGESEPADYLYKVVSGTVRTYKVLTDGRRARARPLEGDPKERSKFSGLEHPPSFVGYRDAVHSLAHQPDGRFDCRLSLFATVPGPLKLLSARMAGRV